MEGFRNENMNIALDFACDKGHWSIQCCSVLNLHSGPHFRQLALDFSWLNSVALADIGRGSMNAALLVVKCTFTAQK